MWFKLLVFWGLLYTTTHCLNGTSLEAWREHCTISHLKIHTLVEDCKAGVGWLDCINYTEPIKEVRCRGVELYEVHPYIPKDTVTLINTDKELADKYLSRAVLTNLTMLETLTMKRLKLRAFTSKFLTGLESLVNLDLSQNLIYGLTSSCFQKAPHIENLILNANAVRDLSLINRAVKNLKRLKTLSLNKNTFLEEIRLDSFRELENLTSLVALDLKDCMIERVEDGSLGPLKALRDIDIGYNRIDKDGLYNITNGLRGSDLRILNMQFLFKINQIPTSALAPLADTPIERLIMSKNYYLNLEGGCFPPLETLKALYLRSCSISHIDRGAFVNLANLQELYLSDNGFVALVQLAFQVPKLVILEIERLRNPLYRPILHLNVSNLRDLKELKLSSTYIQMEKQLIANLTSLENLDLSESGISEIEDGTFQDLGNLQILKLASNSIAELSNNTLRGLENLKHLYLRGTDLNFKSHTLPFQHLNSLEVLDLRRNDISYLPRGIFSSLKKLELLFLQQNFVGGWNYPVLPLNGSLRVVILTSNQIHNVTELMLQEFEDLETLDLSLNPLDCSDCGMDRFQNWSKHTKVDLGGIKDPAKYSCLDGAQTVAFYNATINNQEHCFPLVVGVLFEWLLALGVVLSVAVVALVSAYHARWYIRYWVFQVKSKVRRYKESTTEDKQQYEYDAFISYCHTDCEWITLHLVPSLETDLNLKLCLHDRDFKVGLPITENILESIEKSRKTVMVISEAFVGSEWCIFEMHMAQHALFESSRDALLLVQLNEVAKDKLDNNLKYLMRTRTYIPWPEDSPVGQKLFWKRLAEALTSSAKDIPLQLV